MLISRKSLNVSAALLASSAALSLLAGCSPQDSVSFKSGGMTHTFSEGKDAIPKDFVLPVYPGASATGSVSAEGNDQEESKFLMLSTADAMDKVSEYYQSALPQKGWTVDKVDTDSPNMVSITAHLNDTQGNVMLAVDAGKTTISLSVSKTGDTSKEDAESNSENYQPDKVNPPSD
jgi:hypothetical protein